MTKFYLAACLGLSLIFAGSKTFAQDSTRAQFPNMLANSYIGVHAGYIDYPFTNALLAPGYSAEKIVKPFPAVKVILGHEFNKYFSAQISYLRPVLWVEYRNVNGDNGEHAIFMNVFGVTGKGMVPLSKKLTAYAEAGGAIVTRAGFNTNNVQIAGSTNYLTYELGAGLHYKMNKRADLVGSVTYAAGNSNEKQPRTMFYGLGVNYYMRPLSKEAVAKNSSGHYAFPHNVIQIGYSTNAIGYGINYWFSKAPIPVFWDGNIRATHGITLQYQRNSFHGRRFFQIDWGANVSYFQTELNKQDFFTVSLYPAMRFWPLRTKPFDLYFNAAVAGPTYFSEKMLDNRITGEHFTFYDYLGMGFLMGEKRNLNFEFRIAHYSNGNIFYDNPGILIPMCFNLGYAF